MSFYRSIYDSIILIFLCCVEAVFHINSSNRSVRRNNYNVHSIDFTELCLLCKSCTSHTSLLVILVEEVLECNSCKSLILSINLNAFLCLQCLMETIAESTSRHYTASKLINNQDLIIFYNIVLISMHQSMCTNSLKHAVIFVDMLWICKISYIQIILYLLNALFSKYNEVILLIYKIISILLNLLTHNSLSLCDFSRSCTSLHSLSKIIADLV